MATNTVTNIPISSRFYNLTNLNKIAPPYVVGTLTAVASFPMNGIAEANSRFYFKIVDFNGDTVYQNEAYDLIPVYSNPDVLGANPETWVNSAPIAPVDSNNLVLQGEYTFTVIQRDETQSETDLFTRSVTIDFGYDRVATSVDPSVNIFTPSIVLSDNTSYNVSDAVTNDPITPTITRAWKFYYPSVLDLTPLSGSGSTFTTFIFYEGNQEWKLTSTLIYSFDTTDAQDEFLVTDTLVTTNTIDIPENICDLFCCASSVEASYWAARGSAGQSVLASQFFGVSSYLSLISNALLCGNTDNVTTWMDRAKIIANCNDDCGCGDDSGLPRQITGFGNPTITNKIVNTADGANTTFPIDVADKNLLINKSWTNGEIQLIVEGDVLESIGASNASFDTTTGEFTLSWTPSNGVPVVIQILK